MNVPGDESLSSAHLTYTNAEPQSSRRRQHRQVLFHDDKATR